jgi:hypothetical protein
MCRHIAQALHRKTPGYCDAPFPHLATLQQAQEQSVHQFRMSTQHGYLGDKSAGFFMIKSTYRAE